jgi:hypothetical protein
MPDDNAELSETQQALNIGLLIVIVDRFAVSGA